VKIVGCDLNRACISSYKQRPLQLMRTLACQEVAVRVQWGEKNHTESECANSLDTMRASAPSSAGLVVNPRFRC
jgi:hypothetical protein